MDRRLVVVDLLVDLHLPIIYYLCIFPLCSFPTATGKVFVGGKSDALFCASECRTVRSGEFSGIFAGLLPFLLGLLNHVFLGRVVYHFWTVPCGAVVSGAPRGIGGIYPLIH